jgi:exosortase
VNRGLTAAPSTVVSAPSRWRTNAPAIAAGLAFAVLFAGPFLDLASDWWSDPDAAHGLLLAPLAIALAWKSGVDRVARPQLLLGCALLAVAVIIRYIAGLATEIFSMRLSMIMAAGGLIVCAFGIRQVTRWWLPGTLLVLSLPLPELVLNSVALPLQLQASAMGASLLSSRHIPVVLAGNVIHLPGQTLFVTEACSGLRSLSALIALGVLMGGLWLQRPWLRVFVVLVSVPVAILMNGLRVFLTGYLVHFGSPNLGAGFMHWSEGWVLFVAAFAVIGAMTWLLNQSEQFIAARAA